MNRIKLNIFALGILFPFLLFGADIEGNTSIKLDAYGGPGSILLIWDLPENEIISSIRIFRSNDMMSTYEIIDLDGIITDRYLDNDLFTHDLLFYRLEMETIDSRILSSAYHTPAFARSMDTQHLDKIIAELEQSYPVTFSARSEITDIHEFESVLIYDFILNHIPSEISQMNALQMYLLMEEINFDSFLNILSVEDFKACTFLFADNDPSALHDYIENAFNELEPLFRQQVLFAPAEWHDEKLDLIDILNRKFSSAIEIYRDDSAFLESLPPVLITNLVKDSSGLKISINRFRVNESSIELHMNEESISVPFEYNDSQMISIPSHWEYVELLIAGDVVQSLPVVNEEGVLSIALDDQYIFSDEIFDLKTMRSIPEQDFQLNEIAYNAIEQKLSVEIAGNSDWSIQLGLFINDSLLWVWNSVPGFEMSFLDSNWVLMTSKENGWLHLCQVNENDAWKILESRPLHLQESFHESKVPDLGTWTALSFSTFGESNDITRSQQNKQFIPEIFALYQNYPNPFNSNTNITFDLLDEATVSLYVADAKGRKLQVYLDEIFLEKGFYSFNWSAEFQSSGIYFITLQAQTSDYLPVAMSRKMIYLK
mgnify:FL=1